MAIKRRALRQARCSKRITGDDFVAMTEARDAWIAAVDAYNVARLAYDRVFGVEQVRAYHALVKAQSTRDAAEAAFRAAVAAVAPRQWSFRLGANGKAAAEFPIWSPRFERIAEKRRRAEWRARRDRRLAELAMKGE